MKLEKTCASKFLGRCSCERDYDETKHPNNYDCKDYRELHYVIFLVDGDASKTIDKWMEEEKC